MHFLVKSKYIKDHLVEVRSLLCQTLVFTAATKGGIHDLLSPADYADLADLFFKSQLSAMWAQTQGRLVTRGLIPLIAVSTR